MAPSLRSAAPPIPGTRAATTRARPAADTAALVEALRRYTWEPVAFAAGVLGITPDPWQCDVLDALMEAESVAIRSSHGTGKCCDASSDILLADGRYVIADQLINKRFEVIAFHADGSLKAAEAVAEDNGFRDIVEVETAYGRRLRRTPEHPLKTWGSWTAAQDLVPGDRVLMPLRLPIEGGQAMRVDEIKILAYLIADGDLGGIGFSKAAPGPVLSEWKAAVTALGDRWRRAKNNSNSYYIAGGRVRSLLRTHGLIGSRSAQKFVPAAIFSAPNWQVALFLNRLFSCDGYACRRWTGRRHIAGGEVGYASMSRQLVTDIQRLLLRLGIVAAVRSRPARWTHKGVTKEKVGWTIVMADREAVTAFAERVGILGKEDALAEAVQASRDQAILGRGLTRGATVWPPEVRGHLIARAAHMGIPCFRIRQDTGVYLDRGRPMPLRGDAVRKVAAYLDDPWLMRLANGDYGWDTVTRVTAQPPCPTVAISVPGPETYITDLVEHNSLILAAAALHFTATRPFPKVPMTAPTYNKQVRDIMWAEMHKLWRGVADRWPWLYHQFELNQTRFQHVEYPTEWFAVGIASSKAVNMEGYHADHVMVVFDEAKGIPAPAWQAVYGTRTTHEAKLLVASTPGGPTGEFFKVFTKLRSTWKHTFVIHPKPLEAMVGVPEVMGQDPVTKAPVRGRYSKTGGTYYSTRPRPEWIDLCREEWGADSPVFIARVIGNFPTLIGDNLIPYDLLALAEGLEDGAPGRRVVACDVARYGRDRTTFLVLDGGTALHGETIARTPAESTAPETQTIGTGADPKRPLYRSTVVTADVCARLRREWECETIVIDESVTGDVPVIVRRQGRWIDIVPIASLHKQDSRIYRGFSGIEVLSADGWTPILHSQRHRLTKPLYDVVTTDGRTKVTGDHSLMVGGQKRRAQELVIGEIIDTRRPALTEETGAVAEDLAWALGLFAAEGSLSYQRRTQHLLARIANKDMGLLLRAQRIFESYFCAARNISKPSSGVYALKLADEATRFVERWGYTTVRVRTWARGAGRLTRVDRYKKVPVQVLNGSPAVKRAWLDGYLAGDGCNDRGHWKVDSIDLTLTAGVQALWEALGYQTGVGVRNDFTNVTTLRRLVGRPGWRTTRRLADGRVKAVRPMSNEGVDYVYDLETESHTFVAGAGFLVHHNTGVGGGIADDLKRRGESVIPVNFGASPTDKPQDAEDRQWRQRRHLTDSNFRNLKAEMGWHLRRGFEGGAIALGQLRDPRGDAYGFLAPLIAQTSLVKQDYDAQGRLCIVDPDEQDEYAEAAGNIEGKKSPDHFHALLLGWWVAGGGYRRGIPRAGAVLPAGLSTFGEPTTQIGRITAGAKGGGVGGQAGRVERWYRR